MLVFFGVTFRHASTRARVPRSAIAAFELSGGDGRAARASLGVALGRSGEVSDSDWKAARDRLSALVPWRRGVCRG